jgi:hypothetical protein
MIGDKFSKNIKEFSEAFWKFLLETSLYRKKYLLSR